MSGLGSFIQGAFEGYEYGENIKDRKTQRKRNEKRWEWEQENAEWTSESRDYTRDQREQQRKARERQEAERARMAEIYQDTRESYENGQQDIPAGRGIPGQETQQGANVSTQGATEQEPPTRPRARPPRSVMPQPSVSTEGPQQPMPPGPGDPGYQGATPFNPAGSTSAQAAPDQPPVPGRSVAGETNQQPVPMPQSFVAHPRAQQASQESGVPLEEIWARMRPEGQQVFIEMDGQQTPQATPTPPQTRPQTRPDGRPQMAPRQPAAPDAGRAPQGPQQNPQGGIVQRAADDGRGVAAQQPAGPGQPAGPEQPAPGATRQSPTQPARPGAPGSAPSFGGTDVREASTEELDAQATERAPDEGGAPSVESASTAVQETASKSRGVVGQNTGEVNPRDEKRAADTFMQHYAENAVPKIVEYYLSKGNVEKATAFQEWADSQQVKGQMESWSKAIWAITNGDEDRFIDHMADTYNSIDDGYTIDRKQTELKKDKQGNIVGGRLAVMNDETGEVNIQEFDDQQDIIEMAVYAMAPEQTFEYLWGLSQQARELRIEQANKGAISRKDMVDMIADEADSIRSAQENILDPKSRLTEAQIEEQATNNVYRRLGYGTGASTGQGAGANAQEPPRL